MIRQTSIDTYHRIKDEGLLSRMRFRVYEYLFRHGPLTAGELTHALKGPDEVHPSYHRRLDELGVLGVAYRVRTRPCRITGHEVYEWDVTAALPSGVIKANARPGKGALRGAVAEIRALQQRGATAQVDLDEVADWLEGLCQ